MGIICPYKLWKLSPILENSPERAAPIGYTCTPKRRKSLIHKHSIIILIFQGTQRKAYKNICLMLAAGIEPTRTHSKPKRAQIVRP
nr:MAG TPA: hypothetical protein [Bacteriophage sp.]